MTGGRPHVRRVAVLGTGNFARNLTALLESFAVQAVLFVDEQRQGKFLNRPVVAAADTAGPGLPAVEKWIVAISTDEYRTAAIGRLCAAGVDPALVLALEDDPDLQILRLLFETRGDEVAARLCSPGLCDVGALEDAFLKPEREKVLAELDSSRPSIGLGYYGRGGGFRHHISGLIPLLEGEYNVVTMSDEVMEHTAEAEHHLYLGAGTACRRKTCDLMLSAHVFPCAPPEIPRVSFSHVIYDFNLTAEYHAARIARSDVHYLFASSVPCFEGYADLVRRHDLRNRICIIPGGYLRLDANMESLAVAGDHDGSILYAPTLALAEYPHRELVSNLAHGPALMKTLLDDFPEREIIFRPHPSDLRLLELARRDPGSAALTGILELCASESRCRLDDNSTDYLDSYRRAGLLVSDSSSTAFTFAFSTGRPVLFYSPREAEMKAELGGRLRFVADRERIGAVVSALDEVGREARKLLSRKVPDPSVVALRADTVFNPGGAARYFADNVELILGGVKHPDWSYFNW